MRVLGFSKKWDKLQQDSFTTFRVPRKDAAKGRDWHQGEHVQIVFHPRGKDRAVPGEAEILSVGPRKGYTITNAEANADGFPGENGLDDMWKFMRRAHGDGEVLLKTFNKLTLRWVSRRNQ